MILCKATLLSKWTNRQSVCVQGQPLNEAETDSFWVPWILVYSPLFTPDTQQFRSFVVTW